MKKQKIKQRVDPIVIAAVMAKVNHDALVEWAKRGPAMLPTFSEEPKMRLTLATAHIFGRQAFKRAVSILTP